MSPSSTDPALAEAARLRSRLGSADREPVIVWGRRTAFGRRGGGLGGLTADRLLAPVLAAVLADVAVPAARVDDVIIGNAAGGGGNLARLAALDAGLPVTVPGLTVDRQCGSGLEAIVLACRLVASGAGGLYLAGGVESCSTAPLRAHRLSSAPGKPDFFRRVRFSPDRLGDPDMGVAAETVAARFGISRARQDAFALRSHRLALAAAAAGDFDAEIVSLPGDRGLVARDEGPRARLDAELLQRLPPAFREGGTVTAGNSCADADGAVVVLVTSRARAAELGLETRLGFVDACTVGTDPNQLGIGGGLAARGLLERHALAPGRVARVEVVEAFAAQALASLDLIGVAEDRANRQGGALAFGHPFGASGALLVLRLMQQSHPGGQPGDLALAAVSVAGGLGIAALFRSEEPG